MKTDASPALTLVIYFAIIAAGFALGLVLLVLLWLGLRAAGFPADFWAMTEALATAVGAAAVLGAGFVAYKELNEISSSRHMEVADRLFDELNSLENIAARRWVYQHLPDDPALGIPNLAPEGQAAVKAVLNSLDRVAFLTQAGWIPEGMIMPWLHPMVHKSWEKLEAYVNYERQRRGEPYYYQQVSRLAQRTLAWRKKHLPGGEVIWVKDAL